MLDAGELDTYARGMAAALRVLSPTPRDQVLGMLRGLGLTVAQADAVIARGIAQRIFVEEDGKVAAREPESYGL